MFWSGNYIAVRELNFLLKEDNVTLSQVLEADDILQECKADNKNLIQFITRPEILAELITLITEEPSKNVELASQYRHASIACEVLTSHLSMLSDRLSLDAVQMNRLCDFLKQEPPLNPLLASYFSQTVEMLLERSPKQDCYLYHIVCLRVLDFFKSRTDFLPNLLRHISTSAIADVFKYFIRLDDLFHKTVIEWLDEHQFLECLIQIICESYVPEPLEPPPASKCDGEGAAAAGQDEETGEGGEHKEKGDNEPSEKVELNHVSEQQEQQQTADGADTSDTTVQNNKEEFSTKVVEWKRTEDEIEAERRMREIKAERIRAVAAHNATELLCELLLNGCAGEGCSNRGRISSEVVGRVRSAGFAQALLQHVFTAARAAPALQRAARLLAHQLSLYSMWLVSKRCGVERALAPHLPLLHQALLVAPAGGEGGEGGEGAGPGPVGGARVAVAELLAQLALSVVKEVAETIITLGTATVLVELLVRHAHNSFLSAHVYAFIKHALANTIYGHQYAKHLLIECDILNRFMDVYEENEYQNYGRARAGYMGHVILALQRVQRALGGRLAEPQGEPRWPEPEPEPERGAEPEDEAPSVARPAAGPLLLPEPLKTRWEAFNEQQLIPKLKQHETPLGGYYPSDNTYEAENMVDPLEAVYEYKDGEGEMELEGEGEAEGEGAEGEGGEGRGEQAFISVVMQRLHRDQENWWDDTPEGDAEVEEGEEGEREVEGEEQFQQAADQVLAASSPWDAADEATPVGEGWASFGDAFGDSAPARPASPGPAPGPAPAAPSPAADAADDEEFSPFWGYSNNKESHTANSPTESVEHSLQALRLDGEGAWGEALDSASSVSLANNLLTAMSSMTPDVIANIVNANLHVPLPGDHLTTIPTTSPAAQDDATTDLPASNSHEQTKLQNTSVESNLESSSRGMADVDVADSNTPLASEAQAAAEAEAGNPELSER